MTSCEMLGHDVQGYLDPETSMAVYRHGLDRFGWLIQTATDWSPEYEIAAERAFDEWLTLIHTRDAE